MKLEVFCSEKLGTLTGENEQVAVDLRETQERLGDEWEDRRSCHRRAQTPWRSDWRRHAQCTHACNRRTLTSSRNEALCGDSGVAKSTVNACVKQSKELEAIHHKLEDSHQMLTQMRDTRAW